MTLRLPALRRPTVDGLRDALLTLAGTVGVLCVLATLACVALDVRPVVVQSGSMSPTIPTGSLAFARERPAEDARVGDVVMVADADRGHVMHRVVGTSSVRGRTVLQLQGDANPVADAAPYVVDEVRVIILHVPYAGYPVTWLVTPWGLFGLGAVAVVLARYAFRRTGPAGGRRKLVAAVAAPAVIAATTGIPGAEAAFTDTGTVTSGAVRTYTVPAPTLSCGALGALSVTFTWTAVTGATSYTLTAGGTSYTQTGTSRTVTSLISGGTATVVVNRNYGSTTWTSARSNSVSYTVAVVSLCG